MSISMNYHLNLIDKKKKKLCFVLSIPIYTILGVKVGENFVPHLCKLMISTFFFIIITLISLNQSVLNIYFSKKI